MRTAGSTGTQVSDVRGLVEPSRLSGGGGTEGSPDPTVWGEASEKREVGEEERSEFGEDEGAAGDAEKEKGAA